MKRLGINQKLMFAYGLWIVAIVSVVVVGIISRFRVNADFKRILDFPVQRYSIMRDLETGVVELQRAMAQGAMHSHDIDAYGNPDHTLISEQEMRAGLVLAGITESIGLLRDNVDSDRGLSPGHAAEHNAVIDDIEREFGTYSQHIGRVMDAARRGDAGEAARIVHASGSGGYGREIAVTLHALDEMIRGVIDAVPDELDAANISMITILVILSSGVTIFNILVVRHITKLITRPLLASSGSLRNISESLGAAVNQVNDSAASIAEASNEQAASVEETSATINQTSAMITSNAEHTREAEQIAIESSKGLEETGKLMLELMSIMSELQESSGTVGKIVKTIDGIASQTNLLAINATVEAARAGGDAGRSFGVVAEEVRSLAQKSAQSAADTAEIIEKNVGLTNSSSAAAQKVVEMSRKEAENISKLSKLIAEINAASNEQASGAEQINAAMGQIEKSTQANAATSQQSAASAAMLKELVDDLDMIYRNVNAVVSGGSAR